MDNDQSGLGKLYEKVWRKFGDQPFTYSIRDGYKKYPVIIIFVLLGIGTAIGHLFWQ